MSLSAEQQWRQLPPLTFTRPTFFVAGALEPAYHLGGDASTTGHDRTGLRFEITDAMGHGVEAMLLSTAGAAALRHARTENGLLEEAYRAADRILREHRGTQSPQSAWRLLTVRTAKPAGRFMGLWDTHV